VQTIKYFVDILKLLRYRDCALKINEINDAYD